MFTKVRNELPKSIRKFKKRCSPFKRSLTAAYTAIESLKLAIRENKVIVDDRELNYLDIMESQMDSIPHSEDVFIEKMLESNDSIKFDPKKYDL